MLLRPNFLKIVNIGSIGLVCVLLALPGGSAYSQDIATDEALIDRDPEQLSDLLTGGDIQRRHSGLYLDTANVLTNVSAYDTVVRCHARNRQGDVVGRIRVNVPSMGLRFFLASDIVEQRGFVGSVICAARGHLVGTEIMLGIVHTDIEVHQDFTAGFSTLLFPVSAMR